MRVLLLLCVGLAVLWSDPAAAEGVFYTGNDLKSACDDKAPLKQGLCTGYILAIADALDKNVIIGWSACFPQTFTGGQVIAVVRKFLDRQPANRGLSAWSLTTAALAGAFPCTE